MPAYRRRFSPTVPAGDHLTRARRAEANRYAALGYYYTGQSNLGFRAQAPEVEGISPLPAFGMLTQEQNAALTESARMALLNVPYYRGVSPALLERATGVVGAMGSANPFVTVAGRQGNVSVPLNQRVPTGIFEGTKPSTERPFHEVSHVMDFRFGSPSQTPAFTQAVNTAAASNPAYGNRLSLYGGFGRGPREVYADNPSRLFLGQVPPELKDLYPWLR